MANNERGSVKSYSNNFESNRKESAELALRTLADALKEAEKSRIIDLNELSKEAFHPDLGVGQKEALEISLEVLKAGQEFLDEQRRKIADDLIIKAELYLRS